MILSMSKMIITNRENTYTVSLMFWVGAFEVGAITFAASLIVTPTSH